MNTPDTTAREVSRVVGQRLAAAGVSTQRASVETGIPRATLIRRLQGTSSFQITELSAIATLLGVSMSDITAEAEAAA